MLFVGSPIVVALWCNYVFARRYIKAGFHLSEFSRANRYDRML